MDTSEKAGASGHARVYGSPGERPKLAGLMRSIWPLLIAVGLAGYLLRAVVPVPGISRTMAGVLLLLLAVGLAAVANAGRDRLANFLKGARGEERVARELAFLPVEYTMFHGLPSAGRGRIPAGGDVDHVVLGPTGVFAVETKNWAGRVTIENGELQCDGQVPDRPPLEQVKTAASELGDMIREAGVDGIHVTPVLCFVSNSLAGESLGVSGIIVCNLRSLMSVIRDSCETPPAAADLARIETCLKARM